MMQEIVKMVDVNRDGKIQYEGMTVACLIPARALRLVFPKQALTHRPLQSFAPLLKLLSASCFCSLPL